MASVQNYRSHRHNPVLTILVWMLAIVALTWFLTPDFRHRSLVPGLVLLTLAVIVLGWVSRAYTTRLQDRIIKLEMLIRCRDLLGPEKAAALTRLARPQVIALRFAGDEELPALIERAEREKLSGDDIKRAIRNWRADWDRT